MNAVNYLVGTEATVNRPMQPFCGEACGFLADVSRLLMARGRDYPDVLSFAYFCRRANLRRMQEGRTGLENRLGRGLAFHITPGNIPVNFAFSFAFGLLAGNANIVRVPPKPFPQTDLICGAVRDALKDYPALKERTAFVDYPVDNDITAGFSARADVRVLWGGDRTIGLIKGIPAKPRCIDVAFADRYSLAILSGEAILRLDEKGLGRLAEQYYNDTYLMDQNACSSPQLVLWTEDSPAARERFWGAVYRLAREKYTLQPELAVEKYTRACENAIDLPEVSITSMGGLLIRAELPRLTEDVQFLRGRGGYFYEYSLKNLEELLPVVTDRYQTLCYFGVEPEKLRRFVIDGCMRGIDRIVPVGSAMDIGAVWDGYDLITAMSRTVALQ